MALAFPRCASLRGRKLVDQRLNTLPRGVESRMQQANLTAGLLKLASQQLAVVAQLGSVFGKLLYSRSQPVEFGDHPAMLGFAPINVKITSRLETWVCNALVRIHCDFRRITH